MMADDRGMFDDEIPWRLTPVPPLDPLPAYSASTPDEVGMLAADVVNLETHLSSVTADLASYRELVHLSLDCIVDLTAQLQAKRRRIAELEARIADQQRQIRELLELTT